MVKSQIRRVIFPNHLDYGESGTIDGKGFDPVNVNMNQLTHLNYAFIGIDRNGLPILEPFTEYSCRIRSELYWTISPAYKGK